MYPIFREKERKRKKNNVNYDKICNDYVTVQIKIDNIILEYFKKIFPNR